MSELDLNEYSDKEILDALFSLKASKFMPILAAIGKVLDDMKEHGERSVNSSDGIVSDMIKQLFEDEE